MQIEMKFYGPYSRELANVSGAYYEKDGFQKIYVGLGDSRLNAAKQALEALENGPDTHLIPEVVNYVNANMPANAEYVEADNETHFVYCSIRVNND